ncbi:MAG: helix-turn-helix transcriptional regulator [Actinomycetota bacterium]
MQRRELGDFLRSRRERLSAAEVGLPTTSSRRAPGLRREEVAVLAGVGVSWLTRIEQGRAGSVSGEVLGALAGALRLSPTERDHLFRLAGVHLPPDPGDPAGPGGDVDVRLRRLVDGLAPNPTYLLDPGWTVVWWNEPEAELFPLLRRYEGLPAAERPNLLRLFLEHPDLPATIEDWDDEVRRLVHQFRAHATAHPSTAVEELVDELAAAHPAFGAAWDERDVEPLAPHMRSIRHPAGGRRTYDQHRLPLPDHPGWLLVVFVPVAPGRAALAPIEGGH